MRRVICLFSALGAVFVLSACGIRGDLERPPPVWGEDQRSDGDREHEDDGGGERE